MITTKEKFNIISDNNDLTTDAVPDAPREYIPQENNALLHGYSNEAEEKDVMSEPCTPEQKPAAANISVSTTESQNASKSRKKTKRNEHPNTLPLQQGPTIYNISQSKGIHIGNSFVIQQGNNGPKSPKSPMTRSKELTRETKKLLKSSDPITLDDIGLVSSHVGVNWMNVGRHLKYSDGQLEQFHEDNGRKGLKEVVYQLLLDWKQVNTSKATVGLLSTALWTCQQYDAVEVLTKNEKN